MSTHTVTVESTVVITISDPDVLGRLNDPEFVKDWGFNSVDDVLEHFAYNAVANGYQNAANLDGWADLDWKAVMMDVTVDYTSVD